MALICDTGPLLAALDQNDPDHVACAALLVESDEDLVVPSLVMAELDYWCHERLTGDVWLAFLDDMVAGVYRIEHPSAADFARCQELQRQYFDLSLGVVDASVMALAERLGELEVATLDHRHFSVIRPRHVRTLDLLPA